MTTHDPIISSIEARWFEVSLDHIVKAAEENKVTGVYVAAFWLFYVDYSAFYPPYLSINSVDELEKDTRNQWAPAEWKIGMGHATEVMRPDYERLEQALDLQNEAQWNQAIEAHYQAIARVCRRLTEEIRALRHPAFSDDFVAGIFEDRESEAEYERLVRLSIEESVLAALPGLL